MSLSSYLQPTSSKRFGKMLLIGSLLLINSDRSHRRWAQSPDPCSQMWASVEGRHRFAFQQFKVQGWLVFTWCLILKSDGILWCHCNTFSWNQYCRVRFFDHALGEGFVPQAFIELWIRRSHVGKTVLVHRAVPALINTSCMRFSTVEQPDLQQLHMKRLQQ